MSEYRWLTTNLLTGQRTGDWLPLTVQSFARAINGTGTLTGALNLTAGTGTEAATWITALTPRKTVLWTLLDAVPIWNGIVWDRPHQSALDGTLPVNASTMDSLFAKRLISVPLSFTAADVFDIFRGLINYALTKDVNCGVAGLNLGTTESGIIDTVTYTGTDQKPVLTALADLVAQYGIEFAFRPGFDASGNLTTFLDLGYPELGQQFPASGLAYNMPGNLLDYSWPETGSSSGNKVIATATDSAASGSNWVSQPPHGYDLGDLAQGFPLLEVADSLSTVEVTQQSQVDDYADGYLPGVTGTQLAPVLTLANGQRPDVRDITLGSWCQMALTSPRHPAMPDGSPGYQGYGRITGWTLTPPAGDQQAESTQIQAWVPAA